MRRALLIQSIPSMQPTFLDDARSVHSKVCAMYQMGFPILCLQYKQPPESIQMKSHPMQGSWCSIVARRLSCEPGNSKLESYLCREFSRHLKSMGSSIISLKCYDHKRSNDIKCIQVLLKLVRANLIRAIQAVICLPKNRDTTILWKTINPKVK